MKKQMTTILGLAIGEAGLALVKSAAPGEGTTKGRGRGGAHSA